MKNNASEVLAQKKLKVHVNHAGAIKIILYVLNY